jgi:hypothetical protein
MEKRSFSKEEKLAIIKEASINGVKPTLYRHGIYPACIQHQTNSDSGALGISGHWQ